MDYNITYRKKDKGWQAIVSYKDNTGKWKQKSKQGFKTQKEAKPAINKIIKELKKNIKNNIPLDCDNYTFEEVTQMYLQHSILYKEYNTIKSYKSCFFNFKSLNNKKIKDIKKYDLQCIIDHLIKKQLKQNTIKTYLSKLTTFFRYVKDELNLITNLPTENLKIPKKNEPINKKALNKKELKSLLNHLKGNKFYIVAFIAANTGLRLGEILGLTWNDINFKYGTIAVNKQWKVLKNKKAGFGVLKSKNSFREVPISKNVIAELKRYKKSAITDINNRVAPFNSASIFKYLNPKLRQLAGISIHELRHTYATMLIFNGVDFKTAAQLLGHDVEQTMATYSHVNDDMVKKAKNIIENIF